MQRIPHFAVAAFAGAWLSVALHGAPVDDPFPKKIEKGDIRVELVSIATGLGSPVHLVAAPDSAERLYVIDQAGVVRIVEKGVLLPEPLLDVKGRLVPLQPNFDERGLLSMACDPGFNDPASQGHRRIFTYTSEPAAERATFPFLYSPDAPPNHDAVIASWKVSPGSPPRVDPASRVEVLRIAEPQFNHNGGMIAFGPDGCLYIATGDGGGGNDIGPGHNPATGNAQDPNVALGKMLRIDVNGHDSANGAYGIPQDNPYAAGGGLREIFAIGLRNPWRFAFSGDQLLVGDVGQNKIEMVRRVERGQNHGWRLKEGTFKFEVTAVIDDDLSGLPPGLTPPILQYDRDEGTSIIGGYIYRGRVFPGLVGKYVFGDYQNGKTFSGRLFYADLPNGEIRELRIGNEDRTLGFLLKGIGVDAAGELYLCGSSKPGPVGPGGLVMKVVALPAP